jgi:hypothetical protein
MSLSMLKVNKLLYNYSKLLDTKIKNSYID